MRVERGLRKAAALLVMLVGLSACDPLGPSATTPPPARPDTPGAPDDLPLSDESKAMQAYFLRVQRNLLAQGLLRGDGGGPDVPFTRRQLTENFIRIALYDEYVTSGGSLVARQTASRLRRWEQPIRMNVEFGASVPMAQRNKDRRDIGTYAARLSRATGQPIRLTTVNPNYIVLILNEDERRAYGPRLAELVPGIDGSSIRAITDMPPSTFCLVFAFSTGTGSTYSKSVAVIRGEHPDALRLSCIHEELAQGLGLANDSPAARPSIFNDDEEFGLLTKHDELLLRILYDRRLRPGMTEPEARPIVEQITTELLGGES